MLHLTKELKLRHCPCSIGYVDAWNVFVVGTYELSEQASKLVNGRFGSLVLIAGKSEPDVAIEHKKASGDQLILEQECTNGGVFDFCLLRPSADDCSDRVQLVAAHSNGNLSSYEILKYDDEFRINEIASLATGSAMLTCLDLVEIGGQMLVLVGDSASTITLIRDRQIIRRLRIAEFDYPVWCVKMRPPASTGPFLVLTGSDDCVLRCFAFGNEFQDHRQLFSAGEEEFAGGVTSIEIVESGEPVESGERVGSQQIDRQPIESQRIGEQTAVETGDEANTSNYSQAFKVLVGSYDEKLRIFHCNPDSLGGDWLSAMINDQKSTKRLQPAGEVPIANAGIWKIKHHRSPCFQLITGMYSGVHLMRDDKLICSFNELPADDGRAESGRESGHLIYGCCFDRRLERLLVASFYTKTLYCLENSGGLRAILLGGAPERKRNDQNHRIV